MPTYEVIYRESPRDPVQRKEVKGHAEAQVRCEFEARGSRVLAIVEKKEGGFKAWLMRMLKGKVAISIRFGASTGELAMLCEVLKALYTSGVPLLESLKMVIEETPNPWLRKRLIIVQERLREGDDIYTAMSDPRCRKAFPPLLRETIRTGEANGRLDKSLERMAETFKRAAETKRETISALMYPAFAIIVFMVVCTVISIKIPPALEEAIGKEELVKVRPQLPGAIQLIFYLRDNPICLAVPPLCIVFSIIFWTIGKKFPASRLALTRVERKVPLVGIILYQFSLVRFLDLLSANNETGIQITESLKLIEGSVNDALIEDSLGRMRERILTAGAGLGEAMNMPEELKVFPGLVRQMVRAGEEAGRLTEMLLPTVAFYGDQAKATLKRTLDMMTPIMIILLGSVIGPVVVGVYRTLILLTELQATGLE
jgi:type II secretory pathway component PulF